MQSTIELIEHYTAGGSKLKQAISGLTEEDMQAVPVEGQWSIQHLVIHLADAEMAFADRIKRLIAMDNPSLLAWDNEAYSAKLHYEDQSAQEAAEQVELIRRQITRVLRKLPPETFDRAGIHNERGRQTLSEVVTFAGKHLDHHLTFLYDKREKLGKLMW